MKRENITGLDFETSIGSNGECILDYVSLSNERYEQVYNLRNEDELNHFIASIISSGETYVVFNASFDIEIVMNILLKLGYKYINEEQPKEDLTMSLLSGDKIYKLSVYTRVGRELVCSDFIDLGNLIVGANLKEIAENYTDERKGNYEVSRKNEEKFIEYNLKDARITRKAYINICEELGDWYITIGSGAFDIMLQTAYPTLSKRERKRKFKNVYGRLTVDDDIELRNFYRGGLGWCSVRNRWEGQINSWDKKSAYPYECVCGKPLPTYNDHIEIEGYTEPTEEYPFAFITMTVKGQVKVNHCPVLPTRTPYGDSNKYIYDTEEVYITKIYGEKSEYDWFMENTEIEEVSYQRTILMKKATENPLEIYMKKYYDIKEKSSGVKKDVAKRLINALTGKLGSNPIKYNISYKIDEQGILKRDVVEETDADTYATQVVSIITSRVRCELYRLDAELRDKCEFRLYATDSCKHSTECEVIKQRQGIGQWNEEYHNVDFIYVGLKSYMFDPYNKQGKKEVLCAGISKDKKQNIDPSEFYAGNLVQSKISARAEGGRIIIDGYKRIAETVDKPRRRDEYGKKK